MPLDEIATRHQSHIERLKSHEAGKFKAHFEKMRKQLVELLADKEIDAYTIKQLNRKLLAVDKMLMQGFATFNDDFHDAIIEFSEYEAGFEVRALQEVVQVNLTLPSVDQVTKAVFENPLAVKDYDGGMMLAPFIEGIAVKEVSRIKNAIVVGYSNGLTTPQIYKSISETGIVVDRNMQTMVRTSLQHAASMARQETWKANKKIVTQVKWSATLDSRVSRICQYLDGQKWDNGSKHPTPPAHPNCRSSLVAVLDSKYDNLTKGRTRAERDPVTGEVGSTSANTTYYEWLKRQPASVQDSIIGKTRGKLLRNGGISTERFTELQMNKNFKPMTLEQMRKSEPTAFNKANITTT